MVKYLEGAFKFLTKNYLLAIPLYIIFALSFLIERSSVTNIFKLGFPGFDLSDIRVILAYAAAILPAIIGGYLVSLLYFIVNPITYGLVNKSLSGGRADLQKDSVPFLKDNFLKYVFYFLGTLVVGIAVSLIFLIIILICGLLISLLKGFGTFLAIIILLVLVVAAVAFYVLLSLWYAAMVIDNLPVVEAAKKSVQVVKTAFWYIIGFELLIGIAASIAQGVLFFLGYIPILGQLILAVIPAAQAFIMIYFYVTIYREKTGKAA